jgi:prepilin-type N-terminal cleavage/methylation domain-containing protein
MLGAPVSKLETGEKSEPCGIVPLSAAPPRKSGCEVGCNERAFTLVEIAVVLVIIGLIVGGILVGRDLIETAKERNLITQIQQYNTAVRVFQTKYDKHLPGDIPPAIASQFGLFALTGAFAGTASHGDDNGQIDNPVTDCAEVALFWRHLSDANLVNGVYATNGNAALSATTDHPTGTFTSTADLNQLFPSTRFGASTYIEAATDNGANFSSMANKNFFYVYVAPTPNQLDVDCTPGIGYGFTPNELYAMDKKMDDGMPNTGNVIGAANGAGNWATTPASGNCTWGGASYTDPAAQYNTGTGYGDAQFCGRIIFGFQ